MKNSISALLILPLLGCTPMPADPPATGLPLLDGYRDPADQCRGVGENAQTVEFLDDAADLVACPEDAENLGVFVFETGAQEVARIEGYVLYSVPVR